MSDKEPGTLFEEELDPDVVELALACVPDWVPAEYREFCKSYIEFDFGDGDWLSPECPPREPFSVQWGYTCLREAAEVVGADPDAWFPVASVDDSEYVAYHRKEDGSVEFGRYHFEDLAFCRFKRNQVRRDAPSMQMDIADHKETNNWGRWKENEALRDQEVDMINEGRANELWSEQIAIMQRQFGDKYDSAMYEATLFRYSQEGYKPDSLLDPRIFG